MCVYRFTECVYPSNYLSFLCCGDSFFFADYIETQILIRHHLVVTSPLLCSFVNIYLSRRRRSHTLIWLGPPVSESACISISIGDQTSLHIHHDISSSDVSNFHGERNSFSLCRGEASVAEATNTYTFLPTSSLVRNQ